MNDLKFTTAGDYMKTNERIRLLANQLAPVATTGNWGRVEWADNVYPQLGDKMYAAIDLEKFAELIVRECISMADKESDRYSNLDQEYCSMAMDNYRELVRKHFGVEE